MIDLGNEKGLAFIPVLFDCGRYRQGDFPLVVGDFFVLEPQLHIHLGRSLLGHKDVRCIRVFKGEVLDIHLHQTKDRWCLFLLVGFILLCHKRSFLLYCLES